MNTFPWNELFLAIISLVSLIGSWAVKTYLIPWLEEEHLTTTAHDVVRSVEVMYKTLSGHEKLTRAIAMMKSKGIKLDEEQIVEALEAAWYNMNLDQIAIGLKEEAATENVMLGVDKEDEANG